MKDLVLILLYINLIFSILDISLFPTIFFDDGDSSRNSISEMSSGDNDNNDDNSPDSNNDRNLLIESERRILHDELLEKQNELDRSIADSRGEFWGSPECQRLQSEIRNGQDRIRDLFYEEMRPNVHEYNALADEEERLNREYEELLASEDEPLTSEDELPSPSTNAEQESKKRKREDDS